MSDKVRRRLTIVLSGIAGLAAIVIGGTLLYVKVIANDAPPPLTLDPSPPTRNGDGESTDPDGTWTIRADSRAGYRVDEVLNGLDNTVAGRTSEVTGEVTVVNGAVTMGQVVVDMASVTTDSDARDSQFRESIMNTDDYPTSTFTLTEPIPLGQLATDGTASVTITGDLTIRDVTRTVEASLDVQITDQGAQVAGSIPITFADFEIDAPDLTFVKVEDAGVVEFLLNLGQD